MLTLHGPVVDAGVSDKGNGVEVDPLPEGYVLHHLVGLHLALHLNVENLQAFPSWKASKEDRREMREEGGGRETGREGRRMQFTFELYRNVKMAET